MNNELLIDSLFFQSLLESNVGRVQVELYKEIKKVSYSFILHQAGPFNSAFAALYCFAWTVLFSIASYLPLQHPILELNLSPLSDLKQS